MEHQFPSVIKICVFAAAALILVTIAGCATGGYGLFTQDDRGRYESKRIAAEKSFAARPGDARARLSYALQLFKTGNFPEAENILAPALADAPAGTGALSLASKLAYMRGSFREAADFARTVAGRRDADAPTRAEALSILTFAAYQTDDYAARPALPQRLALPAGWEESVRPLNDMMRAFGTNRPNRIDWNDAREAIVPFLMTDPLPIVEITVNGRTIDALIDTGGASLIIDPEIAASMGITPLVETSSAGFAFGKRGGYAYAKADSVQMGGVTLRTVPIWLLPTKLMSTSLTGGRYEIDGIIGTNVLQKFLSTMDYPNGRLVLRPRTVDRSTPLPDEPGHAPACRVPFYLSETHLMLVRGSLNAREGLLFFLDSGLADASAGFAATIRTLRYAGIPKPTMVQIEGIGGAGISRARIGHFTVDRLALGGLEIQHATGVYGVFPDTSFADASFIIDGIVSHRILKEYAWTIDFDRMEMSFAPG